MFNAHIFVLLSFTIIIQICSEGFITNTNDSTLDKYLHEGWSYFNKTGYYYKVFNISTTWHYAEELCQRANSHLISIHSYDEIKFATDLAIPFSTNQCIYRHNTWIGLFTTDLNIHWSWTDGSIFNLSLWGRGGPDNPGGKNCGFIWTGVNCQGLKQNDFYNWACPYSMKNFICKKQA